MGGTNPHRSARGALRGRPIPSLGRPDSGFERGQTPFPLHTDGSQKRPGPESCRNCHPTSSWRILLTTRSFRQLVKGYVLNMSLLSVCLRSRLRSLKQCTVWLRRLVEILPAPACATLRAWRFFATHGVIHVDKTRQSACGPSTLRLSDEPLYSPPPATNKQELLSKAMVGHRKEIGTQTKEGHKTDDLSGKIASICQTKQTKPTKKTQTDQTKQDNSYTSN